MSKQFGLILPGQQPKKPVVAVREVTKPSIFNESSSESSDADDGRPQQLKAKAPHQMSMMERRMARRMQETALEEDPTVYQYDELYDEMENKREEEKQTKSNEPKKPKYIGRLMQCAERRKLENELRIERQVQKEREEEGEQFKDKESFVTAAYRKKLEEMRKMEEQEKRDEYLEAIGDVTKQKDLDGFYRHLYEQKVGTSKTTAEKPELLPNTSAGDDEIAYKPIKSGKTTQQQRAYRKRHSSEDDEEEQAKAEPETKKVHLQNNIDADSDFSIDSSSSSDEDSEDNDKKNVSKNKVEKLSSKLPQIDPATIALKLDCTNKEKEEKDSVADVAKESKVKTSLPVSPPTTPVVEMQPPKPKKDKSDIWKKRTVGAAFDAAVQKYYERKAARSA